jgi:general secretion pathway protein E
VKNIVTIEDPIEFNLPYLTQTQVNEKSGLTFARGLRSILRQDPDVIMVGEIRDAETASIAVQAGLTGHLILTTVHADSAAGVFNRVIETGVEPFLIASASLGIFSQRLVRTVCPHCRKLGPPSPVEIESLMRDGIDVRQGLFPIAVGCEQCEGKGYIGRTVIGELLVVTPKLQELVH